MSTLFTNDAKPVSVDGLTLRAIMPHGYPFQMIDKIKSYEHDKNRIVALKNIAQNDPFIQGHFPGNPIFPGVFIIEALAQTAGAYWSIYDIIEQGFALDALPADFNRMGKMATILAESKIKHTAPVFPGDQIELESVVDFRRTDMCRCKVVATVDGREVSKGQLTMARMPWQTAGGTAAELPA